MHAGRGMASRDGPSECDAPHPGREETPAWPPRRPVSPPGRAGARTLPADLVTALSHGVSPGTVSVVRTLTRKFPENSRRGRTGLRPGRARSGPRSLAWAPAAPRAGDRGVPTSAQASPPGTALVCLCAASPQSYSDLPGRGLAPGARGQQTRCGQRGAGGKTRVTRPRTAGHCLGSGPNSEGRRTSQGRRESQSWAQRPQALALQATSCPRRRVQEGGPKRVGVRQVAVQGGALSWGGAQEPGWGAQRSLEGRELQGREP